MQNVMFSPKRENTEDVVATVLAKIARNILVVVFGLVPIFFVPLTYAPYNFSKILFVITGVCIALIFYSLYLLRQGTISIRSSLGIWLAWGLVAVTLTAAIFSGDITDALFGEAYGIHTVVFVGLMALIMSAVTILREHKASIMHLYILLTGSGLVIGLFQLVRLLFGPDTLTFGIFVTSTATLLGGWNDLALFFGLSLLLSLVAVEQFPLTKWGKVLFGFMSLVSLVMLAVVNFFAIWIVLGFVSLIMLMYALTKHRFADPTFSFDTRDASGTIASIILSVAVFVCSAAFVVGGSGLGQVISSMSNISYVEVRPSLDATIDIARNVYSENAFTGIGPNKFADAWLLYKNPAINQTIFWNTPFESGVGYIPTFFVTTGIFGSIAWILFLGSIVWVGFRILVAVQHVDRFWYFIGTSSFVSALYLWGMAAIYVPGPAILILAAVFTGVLFTAYSVLVPQRVFAISLVQNKRLGFALVAVTMIVIVGSVSALFFASRQYSGLVSYNKAVRSVAVGTPVDVIERGIASAFALSQNDRFAREILGIQMSKLNTLITLEAPTEVQTKQFETAVVNAINAGQLAIDADPTDAQNWRGLGTVYSILASTGFQGAYERAKESFANAESYDPKNPLIKLLQAQLESRIGNLDGARALAVEAIRLKPNYSEALLFIAQVDIARGDVAGAIESTRAHSTLEPNNPARQYQLGILYSANGDVSAAIQSFERAIELDTNYANARYLLALSYDQVGRSDEARAQLERVLALNPGNEAVLELIARIDSGQPLNVATPTTPPVTDPEAVVGDQGDVTTTEAVDSPLLTPVNTVPDSEEETRDESDVEEDDNGALSSDEDVARDESISE